MISLFSNKFPTMLRQALQKSFSCPVTMSGQNFVFVATRPKSEFFKNRILSVLSGEKNPKSLLKSSDEVSFS